MIQEQSQALVMVEVTDPDEIAKIKAQRERGRKNSDWLQAHVPQVYAQHRGKCICVAGEELFVADTAPEVLAMVRQGSSGRRWAFAKVHSGERMERIYAHSRAMDAV